VLNKFCKWTAPAVTLKGMWPIHNINLHIPVSKVVPYTLSNLLWAQKYSERYGRLSLQWKPSSWSSSIFSATWSDPILEGNALFLPFNTRKPEGSFFYPFSFFKARCSLIPHVWVFNLWLFMTFDEKCHRFDFPPEEYFAMTPYPLKAEGSSLTPKYS